VALSESLHFDLTMTGAGVGVSVLCPEFVRTRIGDSDRNLPPEVAAIDESAPAEVPPSLAGFRDGIRGLVDMGIDPAEVAGVVLDGIRAGRFWILTHPTTVDVARRRWDAIAGDGLPSLWNTSS